LEKEVTVKVKSAELLNKNIPDADLSNNNLDVNNN
jgi:hypothetical protein